MTKYVIEHFIEYLGSGCSCCDPTPFDSYHVKDVETGKYFGDEEVKYYEWGSYISVENLTPISADYPEDGLQIY